MSSSDLEALILLGLIGRLAELVMNAYERRESVSWEQLNALFAGADAADSRWSEAIGKKEEGK